MKPVKLLVKEFLGIEELELDFPHSLFVIVGPNGAGKSSILEAIFFALYGKGIRTERGKKDLIYRGSRDEALRVEFQFLLQHRPFRVVREFSKKRGGAAVFEKQEGEKWITICSGEQNVNREVAEMVGIDSETFKSTVFLPQGETLAFVEANPAERFGILSNLFGLEVLDQVREKVKGELDRLRGSLAPLEEEFRSLEEERIEENIEEKRREEEDLKKSLEGLEKEAEKLEEEVKTLEDFSREVASLKKLEQELAEIEKEVKLAQEKAKRDRDIGQALEVRLNFWQPWKVVQEKLEELKEREAERAQKESKVKQELQAITWELDGLRGKKEEVFTRKTDLENYQKRLNEEALPLASKIQDLFSEVKTEEKKKKEAETELQMLSQKIEKEEEKLRERKAREEKLKEDLTRTGKNLSLLKDAQEKLIPIQLEQEKKKKEEEIYQEEEEKITAELKALKARKEKVNQDLARLTHQLELLLHQEKEIEDQHRSSIKNFALYELETEWREKGICPLCGSEVPFSSTVSSHEVNLLQTEKEYRSFQERLNRLGATQESLREQNQLLEQNCRTLTQKKKGLSDKIRNLEVEMSNLQTSAKDILAHPSLVAMGISNLSTLNKSILLEEKKREELQLAWSQIQREVGKEETLRYLKEAREQTRVELETLKVNYRKKQEQLEAERERLFTLLKDLNFSPTQNKPPEKLFQNYWNWLSDQLKMVSRQFLEISEQEKNLGGRVEVLSQNLQSIKTEEKKLAQELLKKREEEKILNHQFKEALSRIGWSEEYFASLKDEKIEGWQEKLNTLEGRRKQLEVQKREKERIIEEKESFWGISREQIENFLFKRREAQFRVKKELGEGRQAWGTVQAELTHLREKLARRDDLKKKLTEGRENRYIHEQLKEALEARGFKNFLLGILFEELEEESSRFLEELSLGRYRTQMKMKRGTAEIGIIDQKLGGEERFPLECSGGEKTMIALALALALSRIRLRRQGKNLGAESLFIDEGFSPLDEEHLELVADAILRLGQDGRMVGVVTHDPAFASFFPIHLEIQGGKARWKENQEVI